MNEDIAPRLSAPFPPERISWRVGSTNKKKRERETKDQYAKATRGQALAYIDARDVMERLDEVCGVDGWQDSYEETARGRVICRLSILVQGYWIAKSDGAGDTDVEGDKGAISDAFKRAAVKWGIGRYLYDVDAPWVALDDFGRIDHSELPKLNALLNPRAMDAGKQPNGVGAQSAYAARKEGKWEEVVDLIRKSASVEMLQEAASIHKATIAKWPGQWKIELRTIYDERMGELRAREAPPADLMNKADAAYHMSERG